MKKSLLFIAFLVITLFTITSVSAAFNEGEVEAEGCVYTGNPRGYCGHGSCIVQNCVPGNTDCAYITPEPEVNP